MMSNDIEIRLHKLIKEHLGLNPNAELGNDGNLETDFGADSLDIVEITMAVEEEFNIEIPDDAVENVVVLRDLIDYVQDRV